MLSNPSGMAVHFEACPVYTEGLYVVNPGARSEVTFRLNCAGARSIAGHSQVPGEMVVPVPSATGAAKLYWEIDPDGPAAGSVVMVTASRASPPQGSFAPGYITQVGKSQRILVLGTVNCGSRLCLQLWRGQGRGKGYTQLQPPPSSLPALGRVDRLGGATCLCRTRLTGTRSSQRRTTPTSPTVTTQRSTVGALGGP